jgi:hypothetical protein
MLNRNFSIFFVLYSIVGILAILYIFFHMLINVKISKIICFLFFYIVFIISDFSLSLQE